MPETVVSMRAVIESPARNKARSGLELRLLHIFYRN